MNRYHVPDPLPVIVFAVFLHLKLSGAITWSWWWITAPLWITAILRFGHRYSPP